MIKTRISIFITLIHKGSSSQCTEPRNYKKYKNCDRIKMLFSTGDMIEYVKSLKDFTTKLLE